VLKARQASLELSPARLSLARARANGYANHAISANL
jgi:hypothetical protein